MKRFLISLFFVLIIAGCNNEKVIQPDTPVNASWLMKLQIDNKDYGRFQSLFYEGAEENVSKETFQQFGEITTSGTNFKNYELLTFENGEMLLVEFAPKQDNDDVYKIVNVKLVPNEMKSLFRE
ncbi:hypothetical protein [Alkalihalobacillus sp. AL-G]|uniref:hypothetical protein n=1 Tax=Alkalihalobacillus sp. AL-G TaxID=2926399 RepID=UPI00272CF73A|nr:hypothetical protein [Alkalihalobacillus sp. AL-G]WLD94359.1 hypothetical protein MOJ78_05580 [Alkalihalobacillus sp. AL-G]